METQVRDDAIAKNKKTLRVITIACLAEAVAIVVLAGICIYAMSAKKTVYQPTMGASYTLSGKAFSPVYLKDMASDIMQLRLTWNPSTVIQQYGKILSMVKPSSVTYVRKSLNSEIATIKNRKMSSVFYQTLARIDVKRQAAIVSGSLERIDDGVILPAVTKHYLIQFHYVGGTLQIVSIKEEKAHAKN